MDSKNVKTALIVGAIGVGIYFLYRNKDSLFAPNDSSSLVGGAGIGGAFEDTYGGTDSGAGGSNSEKIDNWTGGNIAEKSSLFTASAGDQYLGLYSSKVRADGSFDTRNLISGNQAIFLDTSDVAKRTTQVIGLSGFNLNANKTIGQQKNNALNLINAQFQGVSSTSFQSAGARSTGATSKVSGTFNAAGSNASVKQGSIKKSVVTTTNKSKVTQK